MRIPIFVFHIKPCAGYIAVYLPFCFEINETKVNVLYIFNILM